MFFFISSKKINKIIDELKFFFKDRQIVICKEITKYYEEYIRISVNDLKKFEKDLKGEITIVLSENNKFKINSNKLDESDIKKIKQLINKMSIRDIVSKISSEKEISKKVIYNFCLNLKNEK